MTRKSHNEHVKEANDNNTAHHNKIVMALGSEIKMLRARCEELEEQVAFLQQFM